ncbi:MAG: bifunctional methylenetetrahydrofolate dehydrogenase/methenyltetrahydrofolate cyclohydrolase FolD [Chloroflexi bacterium]|nr:bifunctional methylenetetrahydrofolate dehydrogenase/methenyltetrahydrofolate cyclohydrolase FolD [Chloroflexota bacterium]
MSATIIDGKKLAAEIREEVALKVAERRAAGKSVPGLATVLVGEDPASQVYVRSKHRACEKLGLNSFSHALPATTPQHQLIELIDELNNDPRVHGILVQLPLPDGFSEEEVLLKVSLKKDVDGFHPINIGKLAQKGRTPSFVPCTPAGVIELLKTTGVSIEGKNAVVLGRSNIVGMPVALLLVRENATVTSCHSRSQDLPSITRTADILVASVGKAEMVRADWVKPGAVIIDVGINHVDDPSAEKGYRLVGDVAFDEVRAVASAITPVPGGVGPMTIAMLMHNTLKAAELAD